MLAVQSSPPTEGGEETEGSDEPGGQVQPQTAAAVIKFTPAWHFVALAFVRGGVRFDQLQPQPGPWLRLFVCAGRLHSSHRETGSS